MCEWVLVDTHRMIKTIFKYSKKKVNESFNSLIEFEDK